jgi:hypothetical protein
MQRMLTLVILETRWKIQRKGKKVLKKFPPIPADEVATSIFLKVCSNFQEHRIMEEINY